MAYAGVGGSVFIDENRNGVFEGTELGFPGVLLRLVSEAGEEVSAVTDSSGVYGFNVLPGSYTLTMVEESGWSITTPNDVRLTLEENDVVFVNFGSYFETIVVEEYGSIEGFVFRDMNLNATLETGEPGLSDVKISLYDSKGELVDEALTVGGVFSFTVVPGEYTVVETVPEGYFNTTSAQVDVSVEADEVVEVFFGVEDYSWFDIDDAVVYGFVYNDRNNNKVRDIREKGVEGVTIKLFDGEELVAEVETDEAGFYLISPSSSGEYNLMELDLPGWESSTPNEVTVSLSTGERLQVNFGDRKRGDIDWMPDITGHVFDDRDGDGKLDTGEPGIEGVNVELWLGETLELETTTDEDGSYSFINLPLRVYTVVEIQPSGWHSTTPNQAVADLEDGSSEKVNFGETKGAVISGTVFNDVNVNGVNNAEAGISGVTIRLILSDEQVDSQVTDTNGWYSFTVYKAGLYTVSETNPSGYQSSTPNNVAANIASLTGQTVTVDFGDYIGIIPPPPPPTPTGTIHCYVFHDADGDGVWDEGEDPISGVAIDLYSGETIVATVTTGENGLANFGQRNTGTYTVVENDPEGWVSTTTNTVEFTLSSGETEEIEFGDRLGGLVTGVVFNDFDKDGERGVEEPGIEGVTLGLYLSEELIDETVTSEDGSYTFLILEPGYYWVVETDLVGWRSSTPNELQVEVVEVEEEVYEADFGDYEYPYGDILGKVFDDQDGNGELDEEEPGLEDVVVSLYDEEGLIAATTSDEYGLYSFMELDPGVYKVQAEPVDNYFRTTPGTVMLEVEVGDEKEVNFGYVYVENPFGVIYGTVFNDKNGDLDRGFGELGLSGVTLTLWVEDEPVASETTNEYGQYTFRIDESATYTLVEADPEDWYSTTPNEVIIEANTYGDNESPWDFGDTLGATISGVVWDDVDKDGEKGVEETGLEGVLVELYLDDELVDNTLTNEDGSYSFLILASGNYMVEETDPAGYGSSTPNEVIVSIGELTGQEIVDRDFGDYELKSSITGTVFNDLDGDGVQDEDEDGLVGVTVSLYDESDTFVDSEQTDENGEYLFELSILGRYKVEETNPEGYTSTTSDVVVVDLSEDEEETVDFGDRVSGEFAGIFGIVWDDENGNGIREVELGIPEVTVNLYTVGESNTFVESKTTNEHGQYTFTGLPLDDYLVEEINPEGWTSTTPDEVPVTVDDFTTYEVEFGDIYPNPSVAVFKYVIHPVTLEELESATVLAGTVVEYKFVVGNDGNVPLTDIVLVDDVLGPITLPYTSLDPGQAMIGSSTHEVNEETVNTATVTATYITPEEEEVEVGDEDSASCYIGTIGLTVTKEVGITGDYQEDDDWSNSRQVIIGDTVYYRFTVENTGTLPLYDLTVVDNMLGSIEFSSSALQPGAKRINSEPVYETAVSGEHSDTVTATAYWSGEDTSDTDTASYTGVYVDATLDLEVKGGDGAWYDYDAPVKAGEKVTYRYTLENTGTADLTYLSGYDDEGNDLKLPSSLAAGESITIEYTSYYTAAPGDHDNYMVVYSKESKGSVITGDDVTYFAEAPMIEVLKEIFCWACAEWHTDSAWVVTGEDADFRFTVRNTGNIRLTGIAVVDDTLGTITMPSTALDPGADMEKVVAWEAEAGTHSNTVTVTGDTEIQTVSDEDISDYEGYSPSITLTKEISVDEENWYEYLEVGAGETVYYRFTVENTGDGDLHDVYIDDSVLGTIQVGELDPGETVYKYDDAAASKGEYTNTATVYGMWMYWPEAFESTDSATYFGVEASITVDKKVKRGGDWYDDADLLTGETVEYQYTVKNTGNVPLTNVQVEDNVLGPVTLDKTTLTPGQEATGTLPSTVGSGSHSNTATATGHYESPTPPYTAYDPEDEDTASYLGGAPSITMNKLIKDINGDWVDWATLPVGGTAYYRFIITNNGDVELSNIFVYDPDLYVTLDSTELQPGETTYGYADATVEYGLNPNDAHVEGDWSGYDVWYDDSAAYDGVSAYLQLTKLVKGYDGQWYDEISGPAYVKAGDTVEFRYIIANMCELPFKEVTLYDDKLGWITLPSTEIEGNSFIDTTTTATALQGYHENEATAYGKCGDYVFPGFTSYGSYYGVDASVEVDKQIKNPDGDWVDETYVKAGGDAWYRFIVTNTGEETLDEFTLDDAALDPISVPVTSLAPGISFTTDPMKRTAEEGLFINTVTVTARIADYYWYGFEEVTDTDSASQTGGVMGMTLTKEVSTDNTNWGTHVDLAKDDTVYFRFTVENTGEVILTGVHGYDPDLGQIIEFADTTLVPGQTSVNLYTVSVSALSGLHENTAEAYAEWNGVPEKAYGSASYFGVEIDTVFRKEVRAPGGDWRDDKVYVKTGDDVEYRFVIENDGNVDLIDVVIYDPDLVVTINVGTVEAGDTYTSPTQTVTSVAGAHTNTATLNGETMLGPFAELSDSAEYEAALPGITVTKEVSLDESTWLSYVEVPVGGTVYFRFTVKNTGDVELTDVSLSDTSFGVIASGLTLSVDEEQEYFRDTTDPGPGIHENTATAEGYWHDLKVKDTDDASYLGDADAAPEITVTKMVSLDGSTGWTEHVDVLAGTTVWFRIRVENTGNVQLSGVEVQDSVMATPYVVGDMLPGEDDEYMYMWTAVPGGFENTATATGTYYGDDYSGEDSASVFGGVVDMKLTKYVKDPDGLWQDDSAPAVEGTTVEYKYVLENTGNVPITVTLFRDVTLDTDFTTGALGVGETWTEYASTTAELGVHENQAVAEGQWMDNWVEVEDWAEYEAVEAEPAITVTKEVSKDNADWFDHVEVPVGNTVYFRFTLENTGNVELSAVELSDTTFGVIVDGLTLSPGETATYYRDLTAKLCTHTNTATVTGGWKDATVESTDDASYEGYNPLIAVLKVPSMGAPKTSPVLRSDRDYVIVAEGTFWVNYPTVIADAQYWSTSHNKWQWTSYNPASDGHSFLQMNGADVNWGPFSNGDTGHRYQIEPQGNDASVVFRIVDWYDGDYSNNCSSSYLTVYVYEYR